MDKLKKWIMYWNNTFDVWLITIKITLSTFCIWPSSHIIIHIVHHLVTLHFLWTMDDTYTFNTLAMGRRNDLVVKDFIERSPTTWTISYYWWNKPSYISIITFEINENLPNIRCFNSWTFSWIYNSWETYSITSTTWNGWWRKIWSWKKSWIRKFLVNIWNA